MTVTGTSASGVDGLHLQVGASLVAVHCDQHPTFEQTFPLGEDQRVPATWLVIALQTHLDEHAAPGQPPEPAVTAGELDAFSREIAARARWAMDYHDGDPLDTWDDLTRIAVALVLGNLEYLADIGPGPGYTAERAAVLLVRGMPHRPADLGAWIDQLRSAIRRPDGGQTRSNLWLPTTRTRTDR